MKGEKNQNPEMNFGGELPTMPCAEWEEALVLLAAGEELPADVHAGWTTHVATCDSCATAFAQEKEVLALISEQRSDPDATLLASCRASLEDALDREEERGWLRRVAEFVLPSSWLAPSPAWSAAVLIVIGFSTGLLLGPRVLHREPLVEGPSMANGANGGAASSSSMSGVTGPSSALTALDLHTADVAGINVLPTSDDGSPQVELQLQAQRPVTVQGTVDNDNVKNLLLNVLGGGDRFSPDVRLDAVDLLRTRNNDPQVREALCQAVRSDRNAAVRLKALEALNGAEPQDIIQQTLVGALLDDQNPGVRVEAVNELRDMASRGQVSADPQLVSVLQDRMAKDPSAYIRLQSAAAMRDLGPRGKY
jgi:hypothetical protein